MNRQDKVTKKIKSLIKKAPSGWAKLVAEKMNKCPDSIYRYVRGERLKSTTFQAEVYKHLKEIVAEHEQANIGMILENN